MKSRTQQPQSCRPSRAQAWARLVLRPVNSIMHYIAQRHLAESLPQPAAFAFDHIGIQINVYGRYERQELETILRFLRDGNHVGGGVMLDIGANIGNHSLFFAPHFDRIISFEPHPRTFQLLSVNAQLMSNIDVRNIGLSDHAGKAELQFNRGNMGGATLSSVGASQKVQIELARLDDLNMEEGAPVRLIKLDAEEHEVKLLKGAEKTIRRHQPVILFELNARLFDHGKPELITTLQQLGYLRFMVLEQIGPRMPAMPHFLRALVQGMHDLIFGFGYRLRDCDLPPPGNHHMVLALPSGQTPEIKNS